MSSADHNPLKPEGWSEGERQQILEQLDRLLASRHFALSKRYPSLLRHLVGKTLAAEESLLKERLIGVEVFERAPDYNTAEDPIVRITIAEVRKRIAQYYHEPEHAHELRIEINAGSYVPSFNFALSLHESEEQGLVAEAPGSTPSPASPFGLRKMLNWRLIFGFLLALLLLSTAALVWRQRHPDPIAQIWQPFLGGPEPLLFCIGRPGDMSTDDTPATTLKDHINQVNAVTYDDLSALLKVARFFNLHHRQFIVKSSSRTTFADLQQGPVIMVGAFDNRWFVRAMSALRYRLEAADRPGVLHVTDHLKGEQNNWVVDQNAPYNRVSYDYAIVARFEDRETDRQVMLIGGIGGDGTMAAAEFLTNPEQMAELIAKLTQNSGKKNFELVLSTQLIDGVPGPPRVLATETW